jgi:hypothetical protein
LKAVSDVSEGHAASIFRTSQSRGSQS